MEIFERFIGRDQMAGNSWIGFSPYNVMMLVKNTKSLHTHHFDICQIPLGCNFLKGSAGSSVSADVSLFVSDRTIPVQSPEVLNKIILRTLANPRLRVGGNSDASVKLS